MERPVFEVLVRIIGKCNKAIHSIRLTLDRKWKFRSKSFPDFNNCKHIEVQSKIIVSILVLFPLFYRYPDTTYKSVNFIPWVMGRVLHGVSNSIALILDYSETIDSYVPAGTLTVTVRRLYLPRYEMAVYCQDIYYGVLIDAYMLNRT